MSTKLQIRSPAKPFLDKLIPATAGHFYIPLPSESGDVNFVFERFPIVGWEIDSTRQALPIITEFGTPTSDYGFAIQFPSGCVSVHDIYPQTQFADWEAFVQAMHAFAREENTIDSFPKQTRDPH